MFSRLFVLFLLIPFFEVAILVKLATEIGFWETVFIQIGTAFLGASLARFEGLRVWTLIQQQLSQGLMPTDDMVDGLMVFAGGLVLLTPGLITDVLGFLLLLPWTRKIFKSWVVPKFQNMRDTGETNVVTVLLD